MKRMLGALAALVLMPTIAAAQNVCGYSQRASAGGPESYTLSGVACLSREAAIAVARHALDKGLAWRDAITYVNNRRHDSSCFMVSDMEVREISTTVSSDQFDRKYSVKIWEAKAADVSRTLVTADYLDGC